MLLVVDVGNTNIVLGVFKGKKLIQNWRMETDKDKSADEYGMLINQLFKYHNLNTADVKVEGIGFVSQEKIRARESTFPVHSALQGEMWSILWKF